MRSAPASMLRSVKENRFEGVANRQAVADIIFAVDDSRMLICYWLVVSDFLQFIFFRELLCGSVRRCDRNIAHTIHVYSMHVQVDFIQYSACAFVIAYIPVSIQS